MNDEERLREIEATVARYLRRDVAAETEAGMHEVVERFNAWVDASNRERATGEEGLERSRRAIDELEERIRQCDATLGGSVDTSNQGAVDAFNRRVRERNALVEERAKAVERHNDAVGRFNAAQEEGTRLYNREKVKTDEEAGRLRAELDAYVAWRNGEGAERLWKELNHVFASLIQAGAGGSQAVARARALRREMAGWASAEQRRDQCGVLIGEARLDTEPVWLTVDTGSTGTSISPQLVQAMDWTGLTGDMVELVLAGGVRLSAPRLLIPDLSVDGHHADNVKGIVLESVSAGVDGILGLSFLSRFEYTITGGETTDLALRNKGRPARATATEYDVFICHKSEDQETARALFDYLRAEGHRPFFSPVSLGVRAEGTFQPAVDRALEAAHHMVVVGSSRAHMESSWVRGEWQRFEAMRNNRRKTGNLLVLRCGDMQVDDVPVGLLACQAFSASTPTWREQLLPYLRSR